MMLTAWQLAIKDDLIAELQAEVERLRAALEQRAAAPACLIEAFSIVRATLEQDRDKRPHGAALEALFEIEQAFAGIERMRVSGQRR